MNSQLIDFIIMGGERGLLIVLEEHYNTPLLESKEDVYRDYFIEDMITGEVKDPSSPLAYKIKLKHYPKDLKLRQEVSQKYYSKLSNGNPLEGSTQDSSLVLPSVAKERSSIWAQFSVRVQNRNEVYTKLKEAGIPTSVHYPMPLHLQECFEDLDYKKGDFPIAEQISEEIMSLPMNPYLEEDEKDYICRAFV